MTEQVVQHAENLMKQVDSFQAFHWKKHDNASWLSIFSTFSGVALSGSVTAAAFLGYSTIAGMLGIAMTLLIGLHEAFNFSERASFYAGIHSEAKTIRDRLRYRVRTEQEFIQAFDDFQSLRQKSAQQVPKGKGLAVANKAAES